MATPLPNPASQPGDQALTDTSPWTVGGLSAAEDPYIRAMAELPHADRQFLYAVALQGTMALYDPMPQLLLQLGVASPRLMGFSDNDIKKQGRALKEPGWLESVPGRGAWQVPLARQAAVFRAMLAEHKLLHLLAILPVSRYSRRRDDGIPDTFYDDAETIRFVRLLAFSGAPIGVLLSLEDRCKWTLPLSEVLHAVVVSAVSPGLMGMLHPSMQRWAISDALIGMLDALGPVSQLDVEPLLTPQAVRALPLDDDGLRQVVFNIAALREDEALVAACLEPYLSGECHGQPVPPQLREMGAAMWQVWQGMSAAAQGRWSESEKHYDTAIAQLRKSTGRRKGLLPSWLALPYVLSLLAQDEPIKMDVALKFCQTESSKAVTRSSGFWGAVADAIKVRTGAMPKERANFMLLSGLDRTDGTDVLALLMRAWLKASGQDPVAAIEGKASATPGAAVAYQPGHRPLLAANLKAQQHAAFEQLGIGLKALRASYLLRLVDQAWARLHDQPVQGAFFVGEPQAAWRSALASLLAAAGDPQAQTAKPAAKAEFRLTWQLTLTELGRPETLLPMEEKLGARGWGKAREMSLTRLQKLENLDAQDKAVSAAIRQSGYGLRLDLASALVSLVGHPRVAFADRPDTLVKLDEARPSLTVSEAPSAQGSTLTLKLDPMPDQVTRDFYYASTASEIREREALLAMVVVRDGPQRARLFRFSQAQMRVAQLLRSGLQLPREALGELHAALHTLGQQFEVQADGIRAGREVPAEARLRAELTPDGEGMVLRLVVAPLGLEGPRVPPGEGRARLLSMSGGEAVATNRALQDERAHLEAVIDALPMLADADPIADPLAGAGAGLKAAEPSLAGRYGKAAFVEQVGPAAWRLPTPEDMLAALEVLPKLPAIAGLDWPKSKPVSVMQAQVSQLRVKVKSSHDWLILDGGIAVDEKLVFNMRELLSWAGGSRSRYMPLGDGRYLALTEDLKARLDELNRVGELGRAEVDRLVKVPPVAAGWLGGALEGVDLLADEAFYQRVKKLADAQTLQPQLPSTLQAELRPYQLEGYQWAMRLAEAGFGACLADDMGLGKTLQALAVILSRAAGGPTLVVAPTSLIGNWMAEARRFAPSLSVKVYAEGDAAGDRQALVREAGAHDVLLVSWQMQQIDAEVFAQRRWQTLVLDEAQAIKNAAAKRSQAAFELQADFRLALTGTPIENRLSELWSIMRVCNPGLLSSLQRFNERFATPIERDRDRQAQRQLRRLIAPFILRRTKSQVLDDLPPRTELVLSIEPDATERAHYEALRREALEAAETGLQQAQQGASAAGAGRNLGSAQLNILAQLTRLRRAACDPRLVNPKLGLVGAKVKAFGELAAELRANGHKALVFSQFVDFLQLLREPLDEAGIPYQYLDGATPMGERTKRVAAFQAGQGDLFLISLKAGGFGLNLTVADYVVIADPWWNPAAEDQASGRAHRIGQQRPVTVYRLVHQGSLEEKIVALHQHKRELAEQVLDMPDAADGDAAGASADAAQARLFKPDELVALMMGD